MCLGPYLQRRTAYRIAIKATVNTHYNGSYVRVFSHDILYNARVISFARPPARARARGYLRTVQNR